MSKFKLYDGTKHLIKWNQLVIRAGIAPQSFRSHLNESMSIERQKILHDELEKALLELKEISSQNKTEKKIAKYKKVLA